MNLENRIQIVNIQAVERSVRCGSEKREGFIQTESNQIKFPPDIGKKNK